jgi:DNA-binding CsgD family transcriptional regulator
MASLLREPSPPARAANRANVSALADEALRALDAVRDDAELETCLGAFCRRLGFDYFSYILSEPPKLGDAQPRQASDRPMIVSSYPLDWRLRYARHEYHQLDAVVTMGRTSRRPFFWGSGDYLNRLSPPRRRLFDEARDFGILSGFTVPVHGPMGECGLFSTASAGPMNGFADAVHDSQYLLQVLGPRVHAVVVERLLGRADCEPVALTEHERVCLSWTMRGKTAWEIAQIVGRSKPTIDYHIQKAIRKLGATNKFHAAFKALQAGLL